MVRRSSLTIAQSQIAEFFQNHAQHAFTNSHLCQIFSDQKTRWKIAPSTSSGDFILSLTHNEVLTEHKFWFDFKPVTLYLRNKVTFYEVSMLLRKTGYLSHYSAMLYHDLTEQDTNQMLIINDEQKEKRVAPGHLEQSRIDAAFSRPPRISHNYANWEDLTFCVINGKWSNSLGVIDVQIPKVQVPIRVTSLERTLIDITVRPTYAGGVANVLEAYKRAATKVSGEILANTLTQLQYKYPYYQAVGFYLDYSGCYDPSTIKIFHSNPIMYKFYLDNLMKDIKYSESWNIYYPGDL